TVISGPLPCFATMTDRMGSWVQKPQTLALRNGTIHPCVIGLLDTAAIKPKGTGSKKCFIFFQFHLHKPSRPGQQIKSADKAANTAIAVIAHQIVNWRSCIGGMSDNTIVDFNTPAYPWASHGNIPNLCDAVVGNKILSSPFFCVFSNYAADSKHELYTVLIIFKQIDLPFPFNQLIGKADKAKKRIYFLGRRDGIRIGERVS